jgi:myosin-1
MFKKYFGALNNTFANAKQDKNWGRYFTWPPNPKVLGNAVVLLKRVHLCWWAKMKITALTAEQQAYMRQKVLAYDIFGGKKPWAVSRKFDADYLEKDSNPHKEAYTLGMQNLFATYGDTEVLFADYVNKVNKVGKSQKRGIVVTEKNIYKHDPKNYKVKKFGTPTSEVTKISLSHQKDSFAIVHAKPPYRDLVLDLGIEIGGVAAEKYSEFVTVVVQEYRKLTGNDLPVDFTDKITYNNSRTKDKPGNDSMLSFLPCMDGKVKGSQFKSGKNHQNSIIYG